MSENRARLSIVAWAPRLAAFLYSGLALSFLVQARHLLIAHPGPPFLVGFACLGVAAGVAGAVFSLRITSLIGKSCAVSGGPPKEA
jgi:hypothetical protein